MLLDTQHTTGRSVLLGYGVAIVSVGAALIGLSWMQSRWQAAAHVSILLIAVIITTRIGGTKPGLLATALSILCLNYLLPQLHNPLADSRVHLLRLLSFGLVAGYVVWVIATERRQTQSLRRAHDELKRNNEALRGENAERNRTEEELRASEEKFRTLAENAPAAIFICQGGKVRYSNPAASAITGYPFADLCRMNFWDTAAPDHRDRVKARAEARARGEQLPPRFEVKMLSKDGAERWLDFTESPFVYEGKPAILGIAFDITERRQAEVALRDSQQLLHQVLATLPVGVAVTNRGGDIILANATLTRIWGELQILRGPVRWAQSKGWWHGSRKRIAPSEWASVRALSSGATSLNELIDIETFTGEHKTIQNSAAPIRYGDGPIVGAVVVNDDVTERVRAEEALQDSADHLQQLSRRLLTVQEEERRHLSRELHDEFGQLLATITLHLQAAKSAAGPGARPELDEIMALLQRAGAQVRNLALELRPTLLESAGLGATLRWLAEQYQQRTGIVTEVAGEVPEVTGEVAVACFRVAQEALTNVVRHAGARQVWIELGESEGLLELVVRDDGAGFDVAQTLERAAGGANLGLIGMRERVQILGGQLDIDSRPGHGTRIRVSLPIPEPAVVPAQRAV